MNISTITFTDSSSVTFAADNSTITTVDASGVSTVYSSTPITNPVQPTDVEIDVVLSDGTTKKFVPAQ